MTLDKNNKPPIVVIAGPTAAGKTRTAVALAKKIGGEIISADSMQVYKYMDIGTAKPTVDEMDGVPHYLVDILKPDEPYSVAAFQSLGKKAAADILSRKKIPIICGGTGFYINALIKDTDFTADAREDTAENYRKDLLILAETQGNGVLYEMLKNIDPEAAEKIHPNNVKRVIRALEFYQETGMRISAHNKIEREKEPAYSSRFFVLSMERSRLYERIDERVEQMLADGLVQEVEGLLAMGYNESLVSMQGLGYKEIIPYIKGTVDLENAAYILKRDTRHFAKRQLTWFRRQCEGRWLDINHYDNYERAAEAIANELAIEYTGA